MDYFVIHYLRGKERFDGVFVGVKQAGLTTGPKNTMPVSLLSFCDGDSLIYVRGQRSGWVD